jgi:hypothetical protein
VRDERGQETSENALVWHIYNDEAQKADTLMIGACYIPPRSR